MVSWRPATKGARLGRLQKPCTLAMKLHTASLQAHLGTTGVGLL